MDGGGGSGRVLRRSECGGGVAFVRVAILSMYVVK